jgi:hypothetical protein
VLLFMYLRQRLKNHGPYKFKILSFPIIRPPLTLPAMIPKISTGQNLGDLQKIYETLEENPETWIYPFSFSILHF